jgi:hypothetical protein
VTADAPDPAGRANGPWEILDLECAATAQNAPAASAASVVPALVATARGDRERRNGAVRTLEDVIDIPAA